MMKKLVLLATVLAAFSLAQAAAQVQPTIGFVSSVSGNVSVSGNSFVSSAKAGAPLFNGSSVLVSSDGGATISLLNGCSMALYGGQHLKIDETLTCTQLQTSATQLASPYRVNSTRSSLGPILDTAIISAIAFIAVKNDESVSGQ